MVSSSTIVALLRDENKNMSRRQAQYELIEEQMMEVGYLDIYMQTPTRPILLHPMSKTVR